MIRRSMWLSFGDVFRTCTVAPSLFMACSVVVAADPEPDPASEKLFLSEVPVVLTATRLSQPRSDTPAAVTIIDRDMIKASGARQIADLFRLVPGFQVSYENGYLPKVTYHGLSDQYPRRMQILIDGRSVYSPMFGGAHWSDLPLALEDIERIEVVRGPNAVAYGSNAFVGVISIITRHPARDSGTFIKAASGDSHMHDGLVRHSWTGTDSDTRLSVGYRSDDGYNERPDGDHTRFVNLRSEFRASGADTIELQFGGTLAAREDGMQGDTMAFMPRSTDTTSHFQQLRWRHHPNANEEFSVHYYHNHRWLDDSYVTPPLPAPLPPYQVPLNYSEREERHDLEFQHIFSPASDWRFVWGAGIRNDRVWSPIWFSTEETLQSNLYRLFGNAEWRASPSTVVNAGAMAEKTRATGTHTSPRLALNYHVTPEHTLRAAASRAYRLPEPPELRANFQYTYNGILLDQYIVGSEQNKPEVMTSTEIGYFGQLPGRHLQWDIRIARDQMRDVYSSTNRPAADLDHAAEHLINDATVTIDSTEAQLEYRPDRDTRIVLTHAEMSAKSINRLPSESQRNKTRIESVPRYSSSLLAMRRLYAEWYGSMAYYRVARMIWLGDGDIVEPYSRVDMRLAYKFHLGANRGEAAAVVQNAKHDNYVDFRNQNVFYRRVFFTLSLDMP